MKILTLTFLLTALFGYSQSHRLYNGTFENGMAQYRFYFDAGHDKVIDGAFSYVQSDSISFINGTFKNNQKDGGWTYINDYGGIDQMYVKTTGNYRAGLREGIWKYYRKSTIGNRQKEYASVLNFKNDSVVGKIDIDGLTGQFDDNHNFTGSWHFIGINEEYFAEFRDNILIKLTRQEIKGYRNTGNFMINYDSISQLKPSKNKLTRAKYALRFPERKLDYTSIFSVKPDGNQTAKRLIDVFLDNIQGRFYGLQEDDNSFLLLEKINLKDPEVLVSPKIPAKETKFIPAKDNQVYDYGNVEVRPVFPGGDKKFYQYLSDNFRKDAEMRSGKLFVSFVVEKDGKMTDIIVLSDLGGISKSEAIRVLKSIPVKWAPGEMAGKKVRVKYTVPIVVKD